MTLITYYCLFTSVTLYPKYFPSSLQQPVVRGGFKRDPRPSRQAVEAAPGPEHRKTEQMWRMHAKSVDETSPASRHGFKPTSEWFFGKATASEMVAEDSHAGKREAAPSRPSFVMFCAEANSRADHKKMRGVKESRGFL